MKPRKDLHLLSSAELKAYIAKLERARAKLLRQIEEDRAAWGLEPEPDAEAEPEPEKPLRLPTQKMRRAVERFDAMSEDEQRRYLGGLF